MGLIQPTTQLFIKILTCLTIFIDQSLKTADSDRDDPKDGSLAELSQLSPLVAALAGTRYGDNRFYFPKEMLEVNGLFSKQVEEFTSYINNDYFTERRMSIKLGCDRYRWYTSQFKKEITPSVFEAIPRR